MAKLPTHLIAGLAVLFGSSLSFAQQLGPWKDSQYGAQIKENASDCFATVYDYKEVAQVNGWDCSADSGGLSWIEVARPERVDRELLKDARKSVTIPGRTNASGTKVPDVDAYEVGDPKKARFAMIFVHGGGGDKRLGARDTNMGGNFNRLMNLVVRNGGVYYTPTVDFGDGGEGIQSIIEKLQKDNPGIKVIIACGSAGAQTCNSVAKRPDSVAHLAGWMLTGGAGGLEDIVNSEAYKKNVPMIIAHGSRDGVDGVVESFKAMRKRPDGSNYPVWMQVFDDGGHGTPIRMIDWRASLNWIFDRQDEKPQPHSNCPPPNAGPASPQMLGLAAHAKDVANKAAPFSCEQFFAYPFVKQRDPNANYSATQKSTCVAPRKEETPGEDVGITPLSP